MNITKIWWNVVLPQKNASQFLWVQWLLFVSPSLVYVQIEHCIGSSSRVNVFTYSTRTHCMSRRGLCVACWHHATFRLTFNVHKHVNNSANILFVLCIISTWQVSNLGRYICKESGNFWLISISTRIFIMIYFFHQCVNTVLKE